MPHAKCDFCDRKGMMNFLPSGNIRCKRGIYTSKYSFAVLDPNQYSRGHTILVSRTHGCDHLDYRISAKQYRGFCDDIREVSQLLKCKARNAVGQAPDKIYVCILCDGAIKHLHAHLIPRYPFSPEDELAHRREFSKRDTPAQIEGRVKKGCLGGFWLIAHREKNCTKTEFGKGTSERRAELLADLANEIRTE